MVKKFILAAVMTLVIALAVLPAYASLVPMSWGFPTMTQNNSLSDMQNQFSSSSDFELANVSFPTTDTGTGVLGTTFPTMTQLSQKNDMASQFRNMNQLQSSSFAYPWLSIGFSPVPSMGLP